MFGLGSVELIVIPLSLLYIGLPIILIIYVLKLLTEMNRNLRLIAERLAASPAARNNAER